MSLIDTSLISVLINIIPYQSWLEIGFGVSLFFNIVFGMLAIGILYPFPQMRVNTRLLDIAVGGLWALLGSFFVSARRSIQRTDCNGLCIRCFYRDHDNPDRSYFPTSQHGMKVFRYDRTPSLQF